MFAKAQFKLELVVQLFHIKINFFVHIPREDFLQEHVKKYAIKNLGKVKDEIKALVASIENNCELAKRAMGYRSLF